MRITPLQLYVHIPFCIHKCHYCDFNSHEISNPPWGKYQAALIAELMHWSESAMFNNRQITTVFFGGGTPSLAPPSLIRTVIEAASKYFGLSSDAEITLEANPGAIDADHFQQYREAGVNRLSLGVQSLDDHELGWLERIHGRHEALQAFTTARNAGFSNINLDLIYGLPDQTLSHWMQTLHAAIKLGPEHISCYQLTVEPHTKLSARHAKKTYSLPDDELALSFFHQTRQQLHSAGYDAYEISNFAKPGLQCKHNNGYWLYHDYIGIGAGAAGKWDARDGGIKRYSNIRSPERYTQSSLKNGTAFHSQESLNKNQSAAEALWLGLRRQHGVCRHSFQHRFGFDAWLRFASDLELWHKCGKLAVTDSHIYLAPEGLSLADAIAASVL
jgi:oxygen-independent coproporphyrinogen-3 oxidase